MQSNINSLNNLGRISKLPPLTTPQTRANVRSQMDRSMVNETIDLTSPPSSPTPTTQEDTVIHPTNTEEFQNHEEMMYDSSKSSEYQGTAIIPQDNMQSNITSLSNSGDISRLPSPPPPIPIMFDPISSHNVISYSNQMYQNIIQPRPNNRQELQQQYQQQRLIITTTTRTRRANFRSQMNRSTVNEIVDLTSPPSSPTPTTQEDIVIYPTNTEEFQNHEEMMYDSSKSSEYQGTAIIPQDNMQSNITSLSNSGDISRLPSPPPPIPIMFDPISSHNVISYSNEMYQNIIQPRPNNRQELQQRYQQQRLIITTTRTRRANVRNQMNRATVNETIDLTSPPSSPAPTTQQDLVVYPTFTEEFLSHVEIMMHDSFKSTEYQIFVTEIDEKKFYCVNYMPFDSTILMVGLKYLICEHLPMGSVTKCVEILRNLLKIHLTKADCEQLNLLFVQRMDVLNNPDNALMVKVQDLKPVFKQLKSLMRLPRFRISNV